MPARRSASVAVSAAALLALAACGGTADTEGDPSDAPLTDAAAVGDVDLTLEDGVVRSAQEGMTAAFGTLVNSTDADVTVVGASSDAAGAMELHEVVDSDGEAVMQEKPGGFVVGAGESYVLEPGGDHIMFLGITDPIEAGETVAWTLLLEDGTELAFEAPARDMAAGDEEYVPGQGEPTGDHESMTMDSGGSGG